MLDPRNRHGLSLADAKFLEIIDQYGWHVMSVAPRVDSEDRQEWFAYSTGLYLRFQHPEIILCGLDSDQASCVINDIGEAVKADRKFELDKDCPDIFANGVQCRFRMVHLSQYSKYVCFSQWFYQSDDFPVWQCFWPDKDGYFPWEDACNPEVVELQPLLYKPLAPQLNQ